MKERQRLTSTMWIIITMSMHSVLYLHNKAQERKGSAQSSGQQPAKGQTHRSQGSKYLLVVDFERQRHGQVARKQRHAEARDIPAHCASIKHCAGDEFSKASDCTQGSTMWQIDSRLTRMMTVGNRLVEIVCEAQLSTSGYKHVHNVRPANQAFGSKTPDCNREPAAVHRCQPA